MLKHCAKGAADVEFLENRSEERVHTFEGEQILSVDTIGMKIVAKELFPV
ncbi:MAG: hypothetical protein ACP5SH_09385 [Syntrophobacteraceae bacterium]